MNWIVLTLFAATAVAFSTTSAPTEHKPSIECHVCTGTSSDKDNCWMAPFHEAVNSSCSACMTTVTKRMGQPYEVVQRSCLADENDPQCGTRMSYNGVSIRQDCCRSNKCNNQPLPVMVQVSASTRPISVMMVLSSVALFVVAFVLK